MPPVSTWAFTADYGTVRTEKDPAGTVRLVPTPRFWFVKHFCNLTPRSCYALGTRSDHPKVLFTAFKGLAGGNEVYTFHIVNLGSGRECSPSGQPAAVTSLRAIGTSETDAFRTLEPIAVKNGAATFHLAPRAQLTLTTWAEGADYSFSITPARPNVPWQSPLFLFDDDHRGGDQQRPTAVLAVLLLRKPLPGDQSAHSLGDSDPRWPVPVGDGRRIARRPRFVLLRTQSPFEQD